MERQRTQSAVERDPSNLPSEAMYDILARLPVRSLMRFKCVCKPWRDLVSDPQFIKTHLCYAVKADRKRFLCSVYESDCFFSIDLEHDMQPKKVERIYFPVKKYRRSSVMCSCNGLVILGHIEPDSYALWNPSIRVYKRFPHPCDLKSSMWRTLFVGLCYDSSIDDYKFVLVLRGNGNDMRCYYVIFRFKANSWTKACKFPFKTGQLFRHNATCVNGSLHWITEGRESPQVYQKGVYFEGTSEKFRELELPMIGEEERVCTLANLRGNLGCVYQCIEKSDGYEVWVMKEYGVRESWTKMCTISLGPYIPLFMTGLGIRKVVDMSKKGEVAMSLHHQEGLVVYDTTNNKATVITVDGKTRFNGELLSSETCFDTLVIPTGNKLVKRRRVHVANPKNS